MRLRIFRMLDLIAHGADGHGLVHLLLNSAAEIGFASDGEERGWIPAALPPLRMLAGPIQHFLGTEGIQGRSVLGYQRISTTTRLFPPAGKIKCC